MALNDRESLMNGRATQAAANAPTAGTAISVDSVSHYYRPPKGRPVQALDGISLDIAEKEFVALLGPSGCGKSTLLYLIGGFLPIESGRVLAGAKEVTGPGADRGIVFQHFALFPWKTVLGNVLYGLENTGVPRQERRERARHYIDLVQLSGFEDAYPNQLSGGMKQRAAIARTLAVAPDILLMDEPFGALDAQTRGIMQEELLSIWQKTKTTVVFVTHDVREAVYVAERVVLMSARPGRVMEVVETRFDTPGVEVMDTPEFNKIARYIWDRVRDEAVLAQMGRRP
jgi:NitT/TauT family transport system ATP-binding protein